MRKLPAFAFAGVAAAALAGTAVAAAPNTHVMNVRLPGGSTARVEYVGNVAPKVTITPNAAADARDPFWNRVAMPFPSFVGFDKIFEQMRQQSQEMMRRAQKMAHQPVGAAPYVASYGNLPAGQTSTTVVSVSNGGSTCTRTTEVVSQGPGKPAKVTSNVTGQCNEAAPAASTGTLHRT